MGATQEMWDEIERLRIDSDNARHFLKTAKDLLFMDPTSLTPDQVREFRAKRDDLFMRTQFNGDAPFVCQKCKKEET